MLHLKTKNLKLIKYLDFDWAKDYINQKSIFEFIFLFNKKLINYVSKKQAVFTLLLIKAKYVAFSLAS